MAFSFGDMVAAMRAAKATGGGGMKPMPQAPADPTTFMGGYGEVTPMAPQESYAASMGDLTKAGPQGPDGPLTSMQGPGGSNMQDKLASLASAFGGGGKADDPDHFVAPQGQGALAQLVASLTQAGPEALAGGGLPGRRGYQASPDAPLLGRPRFGFRGSAY